MRVRPLRHATRRSAATARRPHLVPVRTPEPAPELRAEKRARESGGPEDRAFYSCSCGYAFEADVSTSVSCPHCGAGQAW
jgi:rubrerythrin